MDGKSCTGCTRRQCCRRARRWPPARTVASDPGPLVLLEPIPFGHKVALADIPWAPPCSSTGSRSAWPREKSGEGSTSTCTTSPAPGAAATCRTAREQPRASHLPRGDHESRFAGFRRRDGRVGVRNHVAVISSVVCANLVAERIAAAVPGCVALTHPHGCGHVGADFDLAFSTLGAAGRAPECRRRAGRGPRMRADPGRGAGRGHPPGRASLREHQHPGARRDPGRHPRGHRGGGAAGSAGRGAAERAVRP